MITITNETPNNQQVRACRAVWTSATGLRTYTASWLRTDATFESDAPWNPTLERELEAGIAKLSRFGFHVRTETRRTRMSVWVTIDPATLTQQLNSLSPNPINN